MIFKALRAVGRWWEPRRQLTLDGGRTGELTIDALAGGPRTLHAVVPVRPEALMGKLIYAANISLDGYLEDESGSFDWSVPDDEVHAFWNEHERRIGTSLYGRRMYETMRVWESDDWLATEPAVVREYAGIWRDADKVVYSTTLEAVSTARTRIERQFDPEAVRQLKETSSTDLSIGGATIGAEAFRHGLVDECVLLLCPVLVGGGKPALPRHLRLDLELLDHRRFGNGVIYLRHAVRNTT
jgi:dihydrofolate reductase